MSSVGGANLGGRVPIRRGSPGTVRSKLNKFEYVGGPVL